MRKIYGLVFAIFCCAAGYAAEPDLIRPEISFENVKAILNRHGYEVDALKYGFAIVARDPDVKLDFAPIDRDITLVISYRKSTKQVLALTLYFFPPKPMPKEKRVIVHRRVRK